MNLTVNLAKVIRYWSGGPRARVTGVTARRPLVVVVGREGEVGGGRDQALGDCAVAGQGVGGGEGVVGGGWDGGQ